jgi:hypothetical protein
MQEVEVKPRAFVGFSEAHIAAGARSNLLFVTEVPEKVLAAAGLEGSVSFHDPDLLVGSTRAAFEPGRDPASATSVKALLFEPDIDEGAAG